MWDDLTVVTPDDVRRRVAEIEASGGDNERAHGLEDRLWVDVLYTISTGHEPASILASIALQTLHIDYARWYA